MKTRARLPRCTNMAAVGRTKVTTVACILCSLLAITDSQGDKIFPTENDVKLWATALNNKLVSTLNGLSGFYALDGAFNRVPATLEGVEFKNVEPQKLVERMAQTLSKMLSKKMDALWLLVGAAEDAAKNYTYNTQLKKGVVHYYNSKTMQSSENDPPVLVDSVRFKQPVNFSFSSVHIPVEIYDGDTEILNGLQWTAALDDQFRANYEQDNEILWQFFGSQSGFMRTYPASVWNTHNEVDLFDVRRQSWYTQGSSSPKDMMILIDTSGSTHGQALQLMKNAVKSILDTLGENDFVNIVEFNQEANFVSDCFNHTAFVQANYRNKKQLGKDVEELKAQGQADYQVGLRFAFEKFEEFSQNRSDGDVNVGANCNKVIILLTDGGTDNAKDVFEQYNWPNKTVRVFTYAVGPTATPVAAIRWMACANRGYFSQIPAMGAIRARVQDYLVVMGRPLALAYAENTQWTSGHKSALSHDPVEYTQYLKQGMEQLDVQPHQWEITVEPVGLGMMTTVTLPVYNRTQGSSNQTILGVMGIDVPTTELGKHTPHVEIGPVGYSFAINPNGYAVFHPNLKHSGRYMKDPPNIDLMELEFEKVDDEDEEKLAVLELRNKMIEGFNATMTIPTGLFLSPNRKYASLNKAIYAFTNITNTTFRLGLSIPDFQKIYPYFRNNNSFPDIDLGPISDETASLHIAPWDYFGTLAEQRGLVLNDSLSSLVAILKSGKIQPNELSEQQIQMLHHLALSVKASNMVKTYGYLLRMNSKELLGFPLEEVPIHFMAFNGGLTAVYPSDKSYFMEDDFDLTNSTYYKRTMYADEYMIMPVQNESTPLILAARSISVNQFNHRMGVTGVYMTAEAFRNFTHSALMNATLLRSGSRSMMLTCDDVDNILCYLVDDGGFLVTSNQDNITVKAGSFLGQVDPQLWNYLRNKKVYGQVEQYDFQATCKVQKDTSSAGHCSYSVPSINLLFETLSVSWWTSKVTWAFTSFNVYNWWFGSSSVYGQEDVNGDGEEEIDVKEEDCVLATAQYYLLREHANISGSISCDNEARKVITQTTTKTNLMLIITEPQCNSMLEDDTPVYSEPRRITKEEERKQVCHLSRHPRKRVQSYGCYDNDLKEDVTKCGAPALPGSRLLAVITACVAVAVVRLLKADPR